MKVSSSFFSLGSITMLISGVDIESITSSVSTHFIASIK